MQIGANSWRRYGYFRSSESVAIRDNMFACSPDTPSRTPAATQEWITVNKDYSSQRYVDLDQINRENVNQLKQVCEAQLNEPGWFSSGMLMVQRTLYVSTLRATYAVDAATCELRWRHVLKLGRTANISSRGLGYLDGAIFRGAADGRVIALTRRLARCCGTRSMAIRNKTNPSSPRRLAGTARYSSATQLATWEFAAVSSRSTPKRARNSGGSIPFPNLARGNRKVVASGRHSHSIRRPVKSLARSPTRHQILIHQSGRATTSIPMLSLR